MENGRVKPSLQMVHRIAAHFGMGPRELHQMLFAAGYSATEEPLSYDSAELRWTRKGAAQALAAFEPHPAMVFDGSAHIRMANRGWLDMWSSYLPEAGPYSVALHFDLLLSAVPAAHQPRGWDDLRCGLVLSLAQEAVMAGEATLQAVVDDLVARHRLPSDWVRRALRVEPLSTFVIPLLVEDEVRRFTHLTVDIGPRGPTTPYATPRLLLMALLPQDGAPGPAEHPLYVGNFL